MLTDHPLADRACNLECLQNVKPAYEFTGPVKILLIETPPCEYRKKVWLAGAIGLSNMLMAFNVFTALFFTLTFKLPFTLNLHILLCTFGLQLFIPSGILMINPLHGPAAPVKRTNRRLEHIILQICGMGCTIAGTVVVLLLDRSSSFKPKITNIHGLTGVIAFFLVAFASIIGPLVLCTKEGNKFHQCFRNTHMLLGVATFITGSVCFVTGVMKPKFKAWLSLPEILYFIIIFCVIYTGVIVFAPVMKINQNLDRQ